MSAMLYVTATPIGNMGDITLRAIETMKTVSVIACEDTRRTLNLIRHFDLGEKKLISYHEHNKARAGEQILAELEAGNDVVLVSDAGMPAVSDPGEDIVASVIEKGLSVTVLPGATASLTALVLSGLPTRRFTFEGFLPEKNTERKERVAAVLENDCTTIVYVAPHDLVKTLGLFAEADPERRVCACHELTKLHESAHRGTAEQVLAYFKENDPKGEYILIVDGAEKNEAKGDLKAAADKLKKSGFSVGDTAKILTVLMDVRRNEAYAAALGEDE